MSSIYGICAERGNVPSFCGWTSSAVAWYILGKRKEVRREAVRI